jgi:DNA (cytosine-5)-methyltransferase 1
VSGDLAVVSLFAGVGGIDLAAERAGARTVLACEIDKACRTVLGRRFPDATIHDDVRTLTADDLRAAGAVPARTVLTAGWPCQGNSVAGRRAGMDDARSGLWSEVRRLLADHRPAWFVGENVPGLLSVNDGWDYATVVRDLAELGYGFAWRVLDAQHFGVPQRRRRVVIVGRLGDTGAAPVEVLLEPEGGGRDHSPRREAGTLIAPTLESGTNGTGGTMTTLTSRCGVTLDDQQTSPLIVSALDTQQGGPDDNSAQGGHLIAFAWQAGGKNDASGAFKDDGTTPTLPRSQTLATLTDDAVRRLTPMECERLQGFPDGWTDGQADAARYKQMGNSVAVPVFEWVMRRLAAVDARSSERAA